MHTAEFVRFLTTMFAITNPFGSLAIFIGLTMGKTQHERRKIGLQSAMAVAILLLVVTWIGPSILDVLDISIADLQLAGGLVITLIGLTMLRSQKSEMSTTNEEQEEAETKASIAVVPLAIPIIAGPGAITAVLVNVNLYSGYMSKLYISLGNILIAALIAVTFYFAGPLNRLLGDSGIKIAIRLTGLILVAMAMGLLTSGLMSIFPGLK